MDLTKFLTYNPEMGDFTINYDILGSMDMSNFDISLDIDAPLSNTEWQKAREVNDLKGDALDSKRPDDMSLGEARILLGANTTEVSVPSDSVGTYTEDNVVGESEDQVPHKAHFHDDPEMTPICSFGEHKELFYDPGHELPVAITTNRDALNFLSACGCLHMGVCLEGVIKKLTFNLVLRSGRLALMTLPKKGLFKHESGFHFPVLLTSYYYTKPPYYSMYVAALIFAGTFHRRGIGAADWTPWILDFTNEQKRFLKLAWSNTPYIKAWENMSDVEMMQLAKHHYGDPDAVDSKIPVSIKAKWYYGKSHIMMPIETGITTNLGILI